MTEWFKEVWASFCSLPTWVQFWVGLILVPINLAPLAFLGAPLSWLIAALSVGGMLPNAYLLLRDREFGPVMSLSHLALWPPLAAVIVYALATGAVSGTYRGVLIGLLIVDLVSIGFDVLDARKWATTRAQKTPGQRRGS